MARQLLDEGLYHGIIKKQDFYSTKDDGEGTPFIGFDVVLTHKTNDVGKRVELEVPCKRQFSLWLNTKNAENTASACRFLGFTGENIFRLNPWWEPDPTDTETNEAGEPNVSFLGKEVSLDITHQQRPGTEEVQESIWLNRGKKAMELSQAKEKLNSLNELFSAYQKKAKDKKEAYAKDKAEHSNETINKEEVGEMPASMIAQLNESAGGDTPPY